MSTEELALAEAMFELLADKGILNGVEVKERVKKLMAETKLNIPPPSVVRTYEMSAT